MIESRDEIINIGSFLSRNALPVISDIHGDLIALKHILTEIRRIGITRPPLVLGDLIWPENDNLSITEMMEYLITMDVTAMIQGNTDEALVNGVAPDNWNNRAKEHIQQIFNSLELKHLEFLKNLPKSWQGKIKYKTFQAFHASPLRNDQGLTLDCSYQELLKLLGDLREDLIITGHLHTHFTRFFPSGTIQVSVGAAGRDILSKDNSISFSIIDETDTGIIAIPVWMQITDYRG